ncbi:MAG TPA: SDR family oxidoreductase [Microvirga sp.]|jgi:NAD(P)-dependent dehydrogenase (short-subunit alcohol dehydrogenase family)|nr:SDR family oxidoreductase [Microvirga sp.]
MPESPRPSAPATGATGSGTSPEPRPSALVTGAATGLGEAVALAFGGRGWRVALADIDAAGLATAAGRVREAGGEAVTVAVDLLSADGPERMVNEAVAAFGRLDVLVNNAGYGTGEAFLATTAASWDRTLGVNLRAVALATAAAGRHMAENRSGRIVNVTSPASRMALPNYAAYAASKAGVDSLTRSAAVALAPFGVTVNSVAPGMMDTAMQRKTEEIFARLEGREDIERFLEERTRRIPLGRRTDTETVAGMVVWLAADAPDYITAERLNVSGGLDRD